MTGKNAWHRIKQSLGRFKCISSVWHPSIPIEHCGEKRELYFAIMRVTWVHLI